MSDRRTESFYLALIISALFAGLLTVLIVTACRSPFMLIRLPDKQATPQTPL